MCGVVSTLCHDEEKTLTRLVEDWERHVRAEPDRSTIVLARTRAEARALSYLMRERVLKGRRTEISSAPSSRSAGTWTGG